ncbi:39S ribosomal protein L9, mitochondrial isoform X2 [Otolemur garnettii]|uniref:39S ribosomal protein L9, mitochondrial isoform X2 n=1 Tax=Otolemur garnettii TaxID=30611 RepID=UPI000C7F0CA3|nr:39S ribosomal protein L9, mitochondrial isoform X2 [Otolemur garnettii]
MAAAVVVAAGRALLRAGTDLLRRDRVRELLPPRLEVGTPVPQPDFSLSQNRGTVTVKRWWKVQLAGEGRKPRLNRLHRVYKLVEDAKHRPKENLKLSLTQSVEELGVRGDLVSVKKSVGRNHLLHQGIAIYASPENKKLFEEEKLPRQEGKLQKIQTKEGEAMVKFLRSCHLEVAMKNKVKWELNPEIVACHFFKNLGVVVAPQTLQLPEEPITRWGKHWCKVTVIPAENKAGRDKGNKNITPALVYASVAMVMWTNERFFLQVEPVDCGSQKGRM